jgi:hypothetical protein
MQGYVVPSAEGEIPMINTPPQSPLGHGGMQNNMQPIIDA